MRGPFSCSCLYTALVLVVSPAGFGTRSGRLLAGAEKQWWQQGDRGLGIQHAPKKWGNGGGETTRSFGLGLLHTLRGRKGGKH